jgi:hypothetical protein
MFSSHSFKHCPAFLTVNILKHVILTVLYVWRIVIYPCSFIRLQSDYSLPPFPLVDYFIWLIKQEWGERVQCTVKF